MQLFFKGENEKEANICFIMKCSTKNHSAIILMKSVCELIMN